MTGSRSSRQEKNDTENALTTINPETSAVATSVAEKQPRSPCGDTTSLPPPGTRIGQYEIIRELGRGGMGAVYLARDTKLGRRVAIKFLHSVQPERNVRFILEARATARCNHENIVVIHEVDEYQGRPFMVLEYLQGTSLSTLLSTHRVLPPSRAVELMVPVVRALARAHEHNIVHRDLKPDNIFLTDTGTIKVLDFGIAKLMQTQAPERAGAPEPLARRLAMLATADELSDPHAPELTERGALVGTLPYMSPEQWGTDTVDHRTDIWAVGIILFRMVAGKHPLAPATGHQFAITAMLEEPMPGVREACPEIPEELATIIDRCLIKPKEQRMGSARELLDALEPFLPGRYVHTLRLDESPYAGLRPFQESDANRFFGRARDIAAAVARLQSQPLLGVAGPSGVGKSSFVRAGLVPALKHSGEPWASLVVRPGRDPVAALAQLIAPMVCQSATTVSADLSELHTAHQRLYEEPGYLGTVLRSRARTLNQKILLFVDQFEELYTLARDQRERMAFTACLASVADDAITPLRVVISIRSDFLDRVAEDPHFMAELTHGLFFLAPPNRTGLRDALIQPAEMAGYEFEDPAMVEHMLDHLEHTPGALPLLQFAASKLWDLRDTENALLSQASYDDIGGIAGALASHADAVLAELSPQNQKVARALFLRLVTPERTRAIVSVSELCELSDQAGEVEHLVEHLVNARLLVVQTGDCSGVASVEIVHESLIHSWPLLRRWLDENQDDALFLEQLRNAAKQWQAKGRPSGLLWRGEAMEEARRWYQRYRGQLPALQTSYLHEVFALAARSVRIKRYVLAGIIAFLSLLVTAAAVALVVIRDAQKEATAQAHVARRQLHRARAAEADATTERERAVRARKQVARTNQELKGKNAELVAVARAAEKARREAEDARERAERAKRKARRDRRRARRRERDARAAEARAQEANARLQVLLERERERNKKLEERGTNQAIPDVDID